MDREEIKLSDLKIPIPPLNKKLQRSSKEDTKWLKNFREKQERKEQMEKYTFLLSMALSSLFIAIVLWYSISKLNEVTGSGELYDFGGIFSGFLTLMNIFFVVSIIVFIFSVVALIFKKYKIYQKYIKRVKERMKKKEQQKLSKKKQFKKNDRSTIQ